MKTKLLSSINSLLVMLLTALGFSCFLSCAKYGSPYYYHGELVIDEEAGTVNGRHYDNETKDCWKVTTKTVYPDNPDSTITETGYYWDTEFGIVVAFETTMYSSSQAGYRTTYQYSRASEFKDSESCLANNKED